MHVLKGKTAIITGASAGIGESVARQFVDRGANVVLIARNKGPLEKLASRLDRARVATYAMNVTDYPAFGKMLDEVKEHRGTIDYLINNVGAHIRGPVALAKGKRIRQLLKQNRERNQTISG